MESDAPPITADQIIEASKQWSLEGDCTLLKWMNQISKNLEERVLKTVSAFSVLTTTVDRASVGLSNATNNLAALQYSQFVENRVHDDDETLANVSEVPNLLVDETDKSENFDVAAFLKKTIEKMNSCHEAVTISYEDSDEEEPSTNVVYRPKNPYDAKPLPHLYGSDKWKEKWHVGLCDSDNDFSGDENSEQFSESSSTADDSFESTNPTMSEWDSTAWGLNTNLIGERKEIRTPSHDGGSSNQGENCSQKSGSSTPRTQRGTAAAKPVEDQRYYQHVSKRPVDIFDDLFADSQRQAATQVPQQIIQNRPAHEPIISDEPPSDVQSSEASSCQRAGAKKTLNLFDDDEFSSFMHQIVKSADTMNPTKDNKKREKSESPKMTKERPPHKAIDPVEQRKVERGPVPHDIFAESAKRPEPAKRAVASNLFDEQPEPSERTNLFDEFEEKNQTQEPPKKAMIPNLFDDSGEKPEKKVEQFKRPDAPNLFGDTEELFNPKSELVVKQQRAATPEPEDDLFAPPPLSSVVTKSRQTRNLFDDDDEDDDFEKIFATKTSGGGKFTEKTKNLFEDDIGVQEQNRSVTPETTKALETQQVVPDKQKSLLTKGLFDDDGDHENDLFAKKDLFDSIRADKPTSRGSNFASTVGKGHNKLVKSEESAIPSTSKAATIKNLFSDIFQDEPPDDLSVSPTDKKITKVADIFADDFKDNFEEIIPKTQKLPQLREAAEDAGVPKDKKIKDDCPSSTPVSMISIHEEENIHSIPTELTQGSGTKSTPLYTSLFHDEPPPDDEQPIVIPDSAPLPAAYDINLFADVPPDDDFPIRGPPIETKRIHSIFYDDFSETIEASREKRPPAASYIINDEPPPDDEPQTQEHSPENNTGNEKQDKPRVSKLKKIDLQINVAALLPTTKIPSFKKSEIVTDSPKADEVSPTTSKKVPIVPQSVDRNLPENILPNLNRDRVKVQVRRKPSTRKGRQESYRKSLIDDNQAANENSNENQSDNETKNEPLIHAIPSKEIFESKTTMIPASESKTSGQSNIKPALFEDTDSDDGGIFKSLGSKKTQEPEATSVSKNVDSLFHSDLTNFDTPSNRFQEAAEVEDIAEPPISAVEVKSPMESLQSRAAFNSPKPGRQSSKPPTLFGESDDDSDDLFKEAKVAKKPPPSKSTEKKAAIKPAIIQPVKPAASLFSSDEDEGSDDIFGKPKIKTAPKKNESAKTKPTTSLFADLSDDDDDDLFGTAKKKPGEEKSKSKPSSTAAKPSTTNKQQPAKSSNPLADLLDP